MATLRASLIHPVLQPGEPANILYFVCPDRPRGPVPQVRHETVSLGTTRVKELDGAPAPDPVEVDPADFGTRAAAFYRVGTAGHLDLTVTTDDGGMLMASAPYSIDRSAPPARVDIDSPTQVPAVRTLPTPDLRQAFWKQAYVITLGVTFPRFTRGVVTLTLSEAEHDRDRLGHVLATRGPSAVLQTVTVNDFAPGEHRQIAFTPITKDWAWILPHVWVQSGPTTRVFAYLVRASSVDEFGNHLGPVDAATVTMQVDVPGSKINWLIAALAALIAAGVAGIAALLWPPAAAAASALALLAEGSGAAAQDPPEPDPNFAEPEDVKFDDLAGDQSQPESALAAWALDALRVTRAQDVLYRLEAKAMGAVEAQDPEAFAARSKEYLQLVQEVVAATKRLERQVPEAIKEVDAAAPAEEVERLTRALLEDDVPADALARWLEAGQPPELLATWRHTIAATGEGQDSPGKSLTLEPALRRLAASLATQGQSLAREGLQKWASLGASLSEKLPPLPELGE